MTSTPPLLHFFPSKSRDAVSPPSTPASSSGNFLSPQLHEPWLLLCPACYQVPHSAMRPTPLSLLNVPRVISPTPALRYCQVVRVRYSLHWPLPLRSTGRRPRFLLHSLHPHGHDLLLLPPILFLRYSINLRMAARCFLRPIVGRPPLRIPRLHWDLPRVERNAASLRTASLLFQRTRKSAPSRSDPGRGYPQLLESPQNSGKQVSDGRA